MTDNVTTFRCFWVNVKLDVSLAAVGHVKRADQCHTLFPKTWHQVQTSSTSAILTLDNFRGGLVIR
ncbi:hypothetical protein NQ318_003394 [Aromia moschata]|uniref:Uncharacterized protein n=1 Tax=Aromia moschata TaxID=1265417 RepID=A0AAV8XQ21_9CUCU|nr:hypothetical protein NQ318_003394 [Aromia moschata]